MEADFRPVPSGTQTRCNSRVIAPQSPEEYPMPPAKILVVDDSPTELRIVTSQLRNKGYVVTTATDGEDALDKVSRDRPDLIVLDVILPKKNGFQVCRELKTGPDT